MRPLFSPLAYLLDHGVEIVGAIDNNLAVVGQDVGDFAELDYKTGVLISDNAERVFGECDADIAIVTIASYMPEMYDFFKTAIKHGVNIMTSLSPGARALRSPTRDREKESNHVSGRTQHD